MTRVILAGSALVIVTVAIGWSVWGRAAVLATGVGAILALLVHAIAATALRRKFRAEFKALAGAYALGMGLRVLGIGLVVAAVLLIPERFPAAPSMFGYGAVLVPLLFMEIRFLK